MAYPDGEHRNFSSPATKILDGTTRVFFSEALMLPTGLATVSFLTRYLGPTKYGLFTLTATIVSWAELTVSALFSRASVKFISEAEHWEPVGTSVIRLYLLGSTIIATLLFLLADPLSNLLGESLFSGHIRLFALDIPVFSLAIAHRNILTGVGLFRKRALTSAGRWVSRLVLIVLFVLLGFSVTGAILGCILASVVELVISRHFIKPPLFNSRAFPVRGLLVYALPLSLFALSLNALNKMDLVMLKSLGATTSQVGVYGAVRNLTIVPSLFALSFSPLLLSTLSHLLSTNQKNLAKKFVQYSLRCVFWLLPFAGMTVGAAEEIVVLVFGPGFASGSLPLAFLIFAALAWLMISITSTILTASSKPAWPFLLTAPTLPVAFVAHLLVIPSFGPLGAAMVTTASAIACALASLLGVYKLWRIAPPLITVLRATTICGGAFVFARFWETPGLLLPLKIMAITCFITGALFLSAELTSDQLAFLRSTIGIGKRKA